MSAMATLYTNLVKAGQRSIESVPESLRETVREAMESDDDEN